MPRLPLADGRVHFRCSLVDEHDGHLLSALEDVVPFFVFSGGRTSGAVLLDGEWSMQEIDGATPIQA